MAVCLRSASAGPWRGLPGGQGHLYPCGPHPAKPANPACLVVSPAIAIFQPLACYECEVGFARFYFLSAAVSLWPKVPLAWHRAACSSLLLHMTSVAHLREQVVNLLAHRVNYLDKQIDQNVNFVDQLPGVRRPGLEN